MMIPIWFLLLITQGVQSNVLDLTSYEYEEFVSEIENYDSILIKFYSNKCPHCKEMAPAYRKLGEQLDKMTPPFVVAEVDCFLQPAIHVCHKLSINGYPTLRLFKMGLSYMDYEGSRDTTSMMAFIKKNGIEQSNRVLTYDDLEDHVKQNEDISLIGIFRNNTDIFLPIWMFTAKKVRRELPFKDVIFYHVLDQFSAGSKAQLKSLSLKDDQNMDPPTILLHRPKWLHSFYEPSTDVYQVESHEDLAKWIMRSAYGKVQVVKGDERKNYHPNLTVTAIYDFDFKRKNKREETLKWRELLLKVGSRHPEVTFQLGTIPTYRKILKKIEAELDEKQPTMMATDYFGVHYLMGPNVNITPVALDLFVIDFKNGKIPPQLKSDPLPRHDMNLRDTDLEVKALSVVGTTFSQYVTFHQKESLVIFFAEYCAHSKKIMPTIDQLQKRFHHDKSIHVIKYNAIKNDVPPAFEVFKFPTIYFVSGPKKKPILYEGAKSLENLYQFCLKHSVKGSSKYHRDGSARLIQVDGDSIRQEL